MKPGLKIAIIYAITLMAIKHYLGFETAVLTSLITIVTHQIMED